MASYLLKKKKKNRDAVLKAAAVHMKCLAPVHKRSSPDRLVLSSVCRVRAETDAGRTCAESIGAEGFVHRQTAVAEGLVRNWLRSSLTCENRERTRCLPGSTSPSPPPRSVYLERVVSTGSAALSFLGSFRSAAT